MKTIFRYAVVLLVGITAGILILSYLSDSADNSGYVSDSLLVTPVMAQQTLDQANNEIYNSRHSVITDAVQKISPAVASINVKQVKEYVRRSPFRDPVLRQFFPELFRDRTYQQEIKAIGSGFLISDDGYLLTNAHVVADARQIAVTLLGGKQYDAKLVGSDPTSDVALLKIEGNSFQYLKIGDSEDVIIGEWAIAVGNPFGLFELNNRPTVTVGVISAVDRDFGEMNGRIYQDMIQTDASINHGNSGGPLCNALGEVIGMNTFIYSGSDYSEGSIGIGFAIPMKRITDILDDLKKYHKVDRDFWIGLRVQKLSPILNRKLGYHDGHGVVISMVEQGSPANSSGLQIGDIILEINGQTVDDDKDIFEIVYGSDLKVGDVLKVKVWRNGNIKSVTVNLDRMK